MMEKRTTCYFCHCQLTIPSRNSFNIFKTVVCPLEKKACELIADILDIEVTETTAHSENVCKKCFKLVNEFARLEARAGEIRTDLAKVYNVTVSALEGEEDEDAGEVETVDDDGDGEDSQVVAIDSDLNELVAINGSNLSELLSQGEDGHKILVVKDGQYEEIDIAEMIDKSQDDSQDADDGEKLGVLELVNNEHVCKLCPLGDGNRPFSVETKNLGLMTVHLRHDHDLKVFLCDICGAEFKKRMDLNAHLERHGAEDEGEYHCDVCSRVFSNMRLYRIHKRLHITNVKSFSCDMCEKKYQSKSLLEEHQNSHSGIRPYVCKTCEKTFASKYTFKAHMKTHETRERNFGCRQCGKTFLSAQNLQQHIKTHSDVRDFVCDVCGKGFGSMRNLEVHSVVHSGVKPFVCGVCGKAFARKAEIKDHERTHTGERPFQCEHCGARFSQRSNLQSHKRVTHYNDRRYSCDSCNKGFKRRRLLDYHVKAVHTGERPYQCPTCDATFVYPEHFKKHIRIHTGIKPFKCEVCDKAFNSRDNRNAHRFVHSDKKPYECLVCGMGFMRKPLLYTHMQQAGHMNDTIVVNQPRLDKDDVALPLSDQEDVEFTIVDENSVRSDGDGEGKKVYLTGLNDHVIIQQEDENGLFTRVDGANLKALTGQVKSVVNEDGNFVDMDGNVISIAQFDDDDNNVTIAAHVNDQGQLVNEDGHHLLTEDGQPLVVDEEHVGDGSTRVVVKKDPDD